MTEQEAEVMVARLKRVWGMESPEEGPNWGEHFFFSFYVAKGICLIYHAANGRTTIELEDVDRWALSFDTYGNGQIQKAWTYPHGEEPRVLGDELDQFAAQWLPFFRRGCWLSGCPLEASAQEKAEWMQGFSQEELQAWNLKM